MDFKKRKLQAMYNHKGQRGIFIPLNDDEAPELSAEKEYNIEVKLWTNRRSLDANAYFHLLCSEIAKKKGCTTMEDEKKRLNVTYGTLARMDGNVLFMVKVPHGADVDKFYPYTKIWSTSVENGKEIDLVALYKRTSELDTKEFSELLNGTVEEAKELGIEVYTDTMLMSLMREYEEKLQKKKVAELPEDEIPWGQYKPAQ